METTNILDLTSRDQNTDALMGLLRTGSQHLIATVVVVEFESYLAQFISARTHPQSAFKDRQPVTFHSALVPP